VNGGICFRVRELPQASTFLFSLASELTGGSKKPAWSSRRSITSLIHLPDGDQYIAQRLKSKIASFVILTFDLRRRLWILVRSSE
jgi:hypothetical protein